MKATFLTGEYPPIQGGIADHTAYLVEHLTPLNVNASILIDRRWAETTPLDQDENPPPHTIYAQIPNWGWRCWPTIANFLKTHQPDVLHIQYQAAAFNLGGWVNWLH